MHGVGSTFILVVASTFYVPQPYLLEGGEGLAGRVFGNPEAPAARSVSGVLSRAGYTSENTWLTARPDRAATTALPRERRPVAVWNRIRWTAHRVLACGRSRRLYLGGWGAGRPTL